MGSALVVPVHIDALFLKTDLSVVRAVGHFDELPSTTATEDRNADTANLSENVVAHAFRDQTLQLKPGVHLHWAMPDVLQRSRSMPIVERAAFLATLPDGATLWQAALDAGWLKPVNEARASVLARPVSLPAGPLQAAADAVEAFLNTPIGNDMPTLPNRWLVTRTANDQTFAQQWLIESDYLSVAGDGNVQSAVSVPFPSAADGPNRQPFRYLGKRTPLHSWDGEDRAAERFKPLTAIGYGTPTFAAFYPNCSSVFGLFDPVPATQSIAGLKYDVVGWYSDADDDALVTWVTDRRNRLAPSIAADQTGTALVGELSSGAGLTVPGNSADFDLSLFYGGLKFGGGAKAMAPTADPGPVAVSVGQTGSEALSAFLAKQIDPTRRAILEDQIEAIQMSSQLTNRKLDVGPKFQEARHSRGFTALGTGDLWTLVPESQEAGAADASKAPPEQLTVDPALAHALNQTNLAQAEYDRLQAAIDHLRHVTFADWYKYMTAAYPVDDSQDSYPDIEEIRLFIERSDLAPLDALLEARGALQIASDATAVTAVSSGTSPDGSAAQRLSASVNDLLAGVSAHNAAIDADQAAAGDGAPAQGTKLRLTRAPAPRAWLPNEPVVLLTGDDVVSTPRYGSSKACAILTMNMPDLTSAGAVASMRDMLQAALTGAADWTNKDQSWSAPHWHPMLLEWEVEIAPQFSGSNLSTARKDYVTDYITNSFELPNESCRLQLLDQRVSDVKSTHTYRGQSILTPQSGQIVSGHFDTFLRTSLVPDYNKTADKADQISNPAAQGTKTTPLSDAELKRLESWYTGTKLTGANADAQAADPIYTALRAYALLRKTNGLSQALSGFNDALLMHRQTFQIPIADPLGFEDYRAFSETDVRKAVGTFNRAAPQPQNFFHPIRSGGMRLSALRLVDSFGRVSTNLALGDMTTTSDLSHDNERFPILMKPAFAAPTALKFRFLSALDGDVEMNTHPATTPIHGWILPNLLDKRLMVYDADGQALGSILNVPSWHSTRARWEPTPGGIGIDHPSEIRQSMPVLHSVIARIRDGGADYVDALLVALESALDNIDPEDFANHQGLSLLIGRPLAVVQASVSVDLTAPPPIDHGWQALLQDMQGKSRETNGFTAVTFPIRLGEHHQMNDGLAAFWVENGADPDLLISPQAEGKGTSQIRVRGNGAITLEHSLDAEPILLTMLMDPRATVHATTGLLPTEQVTLPPDQYASALKRIQVTFATTPVLTNQDKVALPLPKEPDFAWSWIERTGNDWQEITGDGLVPADPQASFTGTRILRDGWLKLSPSKDATAQSNDK